MPTITFYTSPLYDCKAEFQVPFINLNVVKIWPYCRKMLPKAVVLSGSTLSAQPICLRKRRKIAAQMAVVMRKPVLGDSDTNQDVQGAIGLKFRV